MRSTMLFYWTVAGDGAGGASAMGWFFTAQEANDFFQANDSGGTGSVPPTPYWVCLNKFNVALLLQYATNLLGVLTAQAVPTVSSKAEADEFGVKNPRTSVDVAWEFDDSDKWWVNNMRIAAEKLGL
jgi:hypothetical protein